MTYLVPLFGVLWGWLVLDETLPADALLLVCPAQAVRDLARQLPGGAPVVICAKGIEASSGLLMPEVLSEALPRHAIAMLSGPSFAEEAARGLPTAVSIATHDAALGRALAEALAAGAFRPYWTEDVTGVALGGAIKNVLAIAAGIVEGRGLGHNATAALITRGFAEMARLGLAMGARLETLTGLSGLGERGKAVHIRAGRVGSGFEDEAGERGIATSGSKMQRRGSGAGGGVGHRHLRVRHAGAAGVRRGGQRRSVRTPSDRLADPERTLHLPTDRGDRAVRGVAATDRRGFGGSPHPSAAHRLLVWGIH